MAIERKASVLWLGRTGNDAKASAGAVAVQGSHYFRVKRGIPSLAFSYFNNAYRSTESEDWKKRNPFKEQPKLETA